MTLNWADWIIIVVVLVSCLIGLKRGLIKEALSVVSWIAALFIALTYRDQASVLIADSIQNQAVRHTASFVGLFLLTLLVGTLASFVVGFFVRITHLSMVDRGLGVFFGLARGCVIVMVVLISLSKIESFERDYWWEESSLIPSIIAFENWASVTGYESVAWFKQFLNVG